jgi:hypothetical protein
MCPDFRPERERKEKSGGDDPTTWPAFIWRLISSPIGVTLVVLALVGAGIVLMTTGVGPGYIHSLHGQTIYHKSQTGGCDNGPTKVFCNSGDRAIGGGGACNLCKSNAHGGLSPIESLQRIVEGHGEGWAIACDENGNAFPDGGFVEVICQKGR